MKIAIAQNNYTVGDVVGNARKVIDSYVHACCQQADLVVATELCFLGYPPKDLLWRDDLIQLQKNSAMAARELARREKTGLVVGMATNSGHDRLLNNAAWLMDGNRLTGTWKTFLPTYDVFDETRYFKAKDFGPVRLIEFRGLLIAILICEDSWGGNETGQPNIYDGNLISQIAEGKVISPDLRQKPDLLITINASPYYWGKGNVRFDLISRIAKRIGCPVIYANQVGGNDELVFDGRSFAVDANGTCIGAAKTFEEDLVFIDLDNPTPAEYPFDAENLDDLRETLVLGIRDYFGKCGFEKGVVGLSGGVDSSVTLCLGVEALGPDNMLAIYMPSPFSYEQSRREAEAQARNLGVELRTISIEEGYRAFRNMLTPAIGWNDPGAVQGDVTAENVQALVRGMILMAAANKEGRMVLSTGNKSELAVGYCTLYGDMAGGLSVIGDLPKTLVYRLAKHLNRECEMIPEDVITREPSAELAPGQKDADALPPYEVLDPILDLAVGENMNAHRIIMEGYDEDDVVRALSLLKKGEYKRGQAAPVLKVSQKAFGSGRRMPIAANYPL